jgi:L-iditol 2-dehydrogenase
MIITANSVAKTQEQAVEMARKRGKIVLFGGLPKDQPMTQLNSNLIHYNELKVMGAFSYPAAMHQMALQLIARGKIQADKYITETIPLKDMAQGIARAKAGKALKVVVTPGHVKEC